MKKIIFSLMLSFSSILSLSAMSYNEAREQARFLTDKMAYELNLTDQQYSDCYEINLDYLLSVETADDLYGDYLTYRNADIRHILFDWQYSLFAAADYFFRPLSWLHGAWYFPVYRHYSVGHYYFGHPAVYYSYRGGHGRFYHRAGYYISRRPHVDHRGYHIGSTRRPHAGYNRPSSTRSSIRGGSLSHSGRSVNHGSFGSRIERPSNSGSHSSSSIGGRSHSSSSIGSRSHSSSSFGGHSSSHSSFGSRGGSHSGGGRVGSHSGGHSGSHSGGSHGSRSARGGR